MKYLFTLIALIFLSNTVFSQANLTVAVADLPVKLATKAFEGTAWVEPIKRDKKSMKTLSDSVTLQAPSAARYYFKKQKIDTQTQEIDFADYHSSKELICSSNDEDLVQRLQPFMMKKWEVTNAEYRLFLKHLNRTEAKAMVPDTNCWKTDFVGGWSDPMAKMYFNLPIYDTYPVVGVSYHQAMAYCKWMEKNLNESKSVVGYRIEVDLPNQFEWAFANGSGYDTKYIHLGHQPAYVNNYYDWDYLTKLILHIKKDSFDMLDRALLPSYASLNRGNFIDDGSLYPTSHLHKNVKNSPVQNDLVNGIKFLNTNVSEWCKESYSENWADLYETRQAILRSSKVKGNVLLADLEAHYNLKNDTSNGRLVRGGNWLNEAHAMRNGVNVGTHSSKLFVNPDEQHSTLGFRYVIRLIPLEERPN
jgi:formylglycine-generating enzyme required for sulfatase activity